MNPCLALTVVCAAEDHERLRELKRAAVGAEWELSAGATTAEEVLEQIQAGAGVLVVTEGIGGIVASVRERFPQLRVVGVGRLSGADVTVESLAEVREAILGRPAGAPPR